jgi:broad-specificity NMP kinase
MCRVERCVCPDFTDGGAVAHRRPTAAGRVAFSCAAGLAVEVTAVLDHGNMDDPQGTELLVIGGRSGVGKSSVGHEIHHLLVEMEVMHAFIEGDNLDLAYPSPWEHGLAAANLRDMWRNYRELGYHRLIYTNTLSVLLTNELASAIDGSVRITGVLLTADDDSIRQRLSIREAGSALELHIQRSRERASELDQRCPESVPRVATDSRSVNEVAHAILDLTNWACPRAPAAFRGHQT